MHKRCRRIRLQRTDRCLRSLELAYGTGTYEYTGRGKYQRYYQSQWVCDRQSEITMRDKPHCNAREQ